MGEYESVSPGMKQHLKTCQLHLGRFRRFEHVNCQGDVLSVWLPRKFMQEFDLSLGVPFEKSFPPLGPQARKGKRTPRPIRNKPGILIW